MLRFEGAAGSRSQYRERNGRQGLSLTTEQIEAAIAARVDAEGESVISGLRVVLARALQIGTLLDPEEVASVRSGAGASGETLALLQAVATGATWQATKANVPNYAAAIEADLRTTIITAVDDRSNSRDVVQRIRDELAAP